MELRTRFTFVSLKSIPNGNYDQVGQGRYVTLELDHTQAHKQVIPCNYVE